MKRKNLIRGGIFLVVATIFLTSGFVVFGKGFNQNDKLKRNKTGEWKENATAVFDPAAKAYYPSVVKVSGKSYGMWFGSDSGIGYASSPDGTAWTEGQNPLSGLAAGASHPVVVYENKGFNRSDYKYRIWYWTGSVDSIGAIRMAESKDGVIWENDRPIEQHLSSAPLQLVAGYGILDNNYFYHIYGPSFIIYSRNGKNAGSATPDDKTDDKPMTYSYVMYYDTSSEGFSPDGSTEQIALAYSTDGVYWIRYGDKPVLIPSGSSLDWDGEYITRGTVLKDQGKYEMWYSGGLEDSNDGIGYAFSADGLTWEKGSDNPIMHQEDGVAWRSERTYTPMVIKDGSIYKMWFSGKDASGNYAIGYAESKNKK